MGVDLLFALAHGDARELSNEDREPGHARTTSWRLGRAVLLSLRTEVEGRADVDRLEFPNPRYSLSHCRDVALAVADKSASLSGIGVDLEIDRRLRPQAARFFLTGKEQRWLQTLDGACPSSSLLRLWCIKESVFKANPGNHGTLLADHELTEPAASHGEARTREGRRVEYASWCEMHTCVAVAVCR